MVILGAVFWGFSISEEMEVIADIKLKNFLCRVGTCAKVSGKKGEWALLKEGATELLSSHGNLPVADSKTDYKRERQEVRSQ